jgi:hypothetical protein
MFLVIDYDSDVSCCMYLSHANTSLRDTLQLPSSDICSLCFTKYTFFLDTPPILHTILFQSNNSSTFTVVLRDLSLEPPIDPLIDSLKLQ